MQSEEPTEKNGEFVKVAKASSNLEDQNLFSSQWWLVVFAVNIAEYLLAALAVHRCGLGAGYEAASLFVGIGIGYAISPRELGKLVQVLSRSSRRAGVMVGAVACHAIGAFGAVAMANMIAPI